MHLYARLIAHAKERVTIFVEEHQDTAEDKCTQDCVKEVTLQIGRILEILDEYEVRYKE